MQIQIVIVIETARFMIKINALAFLDYHKI